MKRIAVLAAGLLLATPLLFGANAGAAEPMLKGGGADSADPLIGKWQQAVAKPPLSVTVDYSADGAGGGRTDFMNTTVDFAVTSVPFTTSQKKQLETAKRTYVSVPFAAGSIAFIYHLFTPQGDPIKGIQLTGPTIAKIYTGVVTNWNDPEIAAENPTLTLPPVRIVPLVRGQAAGATFTLTSYLKDQAPDVWHTFMSDPSRNFPDDPVEEFPFFAGVDSRTSSFAISDVVRGGESSNGRLAYVDNAWALQSIATGADIVKVKNAAGNFVAPTPANSQKSIDAWKVDADGHMIPNFRVADPAAYPVGIVHEVIIPTSGLTAEKAAALRTFVAYGLQDGQGLAAGVGDPRLPAAVVTKAMATLDTALPVTTTTTTAPPTSSTTLGTNVLANDATNGGGGGLAFTGPPSLGWPLAVGGLLLVAGTVLRRRRVR